MPPTPLNALASLIPDRSMKNPTINAMIRPITIITSRLLLLSFEPLHRLDDSGVHK
jgi:hypothetical protein